MNVQAFTPGFPTLNFPVTTTASGQLFTGGNEFRESVVVQNLGSGLCFIKFSQVAANGTPIPATASDFPIAPGAIMTLCKGQANGISVIGAATTTLYVTAGEGQ